MLILVNFVSSWGCKKDSFTPYANLSFQSTSVTKECNPMACNKISLFAFNPFLSVGIGSKKTLMSFMICKWRIEVEKCLSIENACLSVTKNNCDWKLSFPLGN